MTVTARAEECTCQRMRGRQPSPLCKGQYTFQEEGKQVRFSPRQQEDTRAIALDGCFFGDEEKRCDGLFIWRQTGGGRKVAALVELKGAGDIPRAFEQLAYVRHNRPEYRELVDSVNEEPGQRAIEMAVIVTNGQITKPERESLEAQYGIRVRVEMHSMPSSPVPDLRNNL